MQFKTKYNNRRLSDGVSRIVLQHSVVLCPVNLSTVRLFLSTVMLSKILVSYSSSLLLNLLPQQKLLPKPTLRSFWCCRCRVSCVVAQNFGRKRRLPATQQHFSPFCLPNHSTSFSASPLIWSAVILSKSMCVVISMFQFTFGLRGTSGAMSARKIEKYFASVTSEVRRLV